MKAMVVAAEGGLELRDLPVPKPGPEEVLIRVRAAGLNRAELTIAAGVKHGNVDGPGSRIGLEWAGEVAAVGENVRNLSRGDRVMANGNGGYAEYALADMGRVHRIPSTAMSFAQAATLPVALQTMHDAVVTHGQLRPGQSVLVQGASSGVGLMAMQIAQLKGATVVIGSSTDAERRQKLVDHGADLAVDSRDPAWVKAVLEATGGQGVDLVIDQVSGALMSQTLAATRILGRIVNVGRLGGSRAEFDFDLHAARRITYVGVTFRTRSLAEVREINQRMHADLWPAVEDGTLALPVDATFPLARANEALAQMRANRHFGKIVLLVD